jgi:uncharacterized membrane protein YbaN (DUF454 family)
MMHGQKTSKHKFWVATNCLCSYKLFKNSEELFSDWNMQMKRFTRWLERFIRYSFALPASINADILLCLVLGSITVVVEYLHVQLHKCGQLNRYIRLFIVAIELAHSQCNNYNCYEFTFSGVCLSF